jgi:hypothetical protein
MESRWCTACGAVFELRAQVPNQTYCSKVPCQKERRRLWQQVKRSSDPDYIANQSLAQRAWSTRNSEYWRNYRETHPDYVAKNRLKQRERNSASRDSKIAKSDASKTQAPLVPGVYRLNVLRQPEVAKSDVWLIELTLYRGD